MSARTDREKCIRHLLLALQLADQDRPEMQRVGAMEYRIIAALAALGVTVESVGMVSS